MDKRVNRLLLATALLGTFFAGTAGRIFNISMPTVANDLGTDLLGISWALLAYQLTNIGLSMIFGRLGDLWGREKVFGVGFLVFSVTSLLCGLSQSVLQLVSFRLLEGVGSAMLQSSARALAAEAVPEEIAGRAQGFMTTAHHTGFLLGPAYGGFMIDYFSWRWAFFSLVPISLIGAISTLPNLKRAKASTERRPVDHLGAVLVFVIMSTFLLVLDRRALEIVGAQAKVVFAAVFCAALVSFLIHERRTPSPFIDLSLFKVRMFSMAAVSLVIVSSCYVLTGFLLPFYLQEVLHLSPSFIGLLFMAPAAITLSLAPLSGAMSDRLGPRLPATLGILFLTASMLIGSFFRPDSHWLFPTAMMALGGITNGLFNPANSVSMISLMPKEHRGFASSVNHVAFGLGTVLGVTLGGLMMTAAFEYHTGVAGVAPTTSNPTAFVAALDTTLLVAAAVTVLAIFTSGMRGAKS
jgi:EmrB/QacA subfamily drug resistance transporter